MGRQEVDTDDATALTPSLYLGYSLQMFHYKLEQDDDVETAVGHIQNGGTVLTDSSFLALMVLVKLGMPVADVMDKLHWADHIRPSDTDLSI